MSEPRKVIDPNKLRRSRLHPDIQLLRSVEQEGENQVITDLDGAVEFRINGRPPQKNRATAGRGIDEEQRREVQETLRDIERRTVQRRREQATRARRSNRWLVAFTRGDRIIEYDRSHHQRTELTFPPSTRRNYYQTGDFILIGEYSRRLMQRVFPELRSDSDGYSFSDMLGDYLGVSDREVKIGYKIMSIRTTNHRTGEGHVRLRAYLFIDDSTAVTFTRKPDLNWNRRRLHQAFDTSLSTSALLSAINTTGALMEVAVDVAFGGGLRPIGRRLARGALRRFIRRSSRESVRLLTALIRSKIRETIFTFLRSVARSIATQVMQNRQQNRRRRQHNTQNRLGAESLLEEVEINWEQVITNAATSAALNIIGGALTNRSNRRFSEILNTPSDSIRRQYRRLQISTPNELIQHFIARKIIEYSINASESLIDVFRQSLINVILSEHNERSLSEELEREGERRVSSGLANATNTGIRDILSEALSTIL